MRCAYRRFARAAIFALGGLIVAPAHADQGLLCVLVPHFKDEYWLSVAHGIEERAAARGQTIRFFEAGGYRALAQQIDQLAACDALDPDAILIGAVSSDAPELLAAVGAAAARRPVIGLVNALHSDALAARVGVDWSDMGLTLGRHLATRFPAASAPRNAILLSGPAEAGWVAPLESGLRRGLAGSSISIIATFGADTSTAEQLRLLERALKRHPAPDIIIGDAPAIEAAMALVAGTGDPPLLAATYVSHSVARGLVGGQIAAAPFDDPIQQGSLAVDAAVEAGRGPASRDLIGPPIRLLSRGISAGEVELSPADYFPELD